MDEKAALARERARRWRLAHRDEINARQRERYATDEAYRERRKEYNRKAYGDEERRERIKSAALAYYRENRDEVNAKKRERYATDPEFREKMLAKSRERYATDEEFRERMKAGRRERYARKRDAE